MQQQQPNLDLSKTTAVDLPSGGKIWQSGVILRRISKFVTGTSEDGLIPIPIFYDSVSGEILQATLPKELRDDQPKKPLRVVD